MLINIISQKPIKDNIKSNNNNNININNKLGSKNSNLNV
jgi:hypothetical protein